MDEKSNKNQKIRISLLEICLLGTSIFALFLEAKQPDSPGQGSAQAISNPAINHQAISKHIIDLLGRVKYSESSDRVLRTKIKELLEEVLSENRYDNDSSVLASILLTRIEKGTNPFEHAAMLGFSKTIRMFVNLSNGKVIYQSNGITDMIVTDTKGRTTLMNLCAHNIGHPNAQQLLETAQELLNEVELLQLERKSPSKIIKKYLNTQDNNGKTTLIYILTNAIITNNNELVRLVLKLGADPNTVSINGNSIQHITPLMLAAGHMKPKLVSLLLEYGADPLAQYNDPNLGLIDTLIFAKNRWKNMLRTNPLYTRKRDSLPVENMITIEESLTRAASQAHGNTQHAEPPNPRRAQSLGANTLPALRFPLSKRAASTSALLSLRYRITQRFNKS